MRHVRNTIRHLHRPCPRPARDCDRDSLAGVVDMSLAGCRTSRYPLLCALPRKEDLNCGCYCRRPRDRRLRHRAWPRRASRRPYRSVLPAHPRGAIRAAGLTELLPDAMIDRGMEDGLGGVAEHICVWRSAEKKWTPCTRYARDKLANI
jgi:hypothetical protein